MQFKAQFLALKAISVTIVNHCSVISVGQASAYTVVDS